MNTIKLWYFGSFCGQVKALNNIDDQEIGEDDPHSFVLEKDYKALSDRLYSRLLDAVAEISSARDRIAIAPKSFWQILNDAADRVHPTYEEAKQISTYAGKFDETAPADKGQFNPEHTLFNEIRISEPVNEEGEPARYLITEAQLQRIRALEADKGLGESVARDQQVTELAEFMGRLSGGLRHFAGQIIDAGWTMRSTPSAIPVGFRDPEFSWATISAENKARMEGLGHDLSCFSESLYAEPPAPVAVVMPERMPGDDGVCTESHYASGWNACLDEFARLNSEPKP